MFFRLLASREKTALNLHFLKVENILFITNKDCKITPDIYQTLKIFLVQAQTVDVFYSTSVLVLYLLVRNEL